MVEPAWREIAFTAGIIMLGSSLLIGAFVAISALNPHPVVMWVGIGVLGTALVIWGSHDD